ncbi:MAG: J domain-containing protein [Chloroflexi bacterium]|nr:J domain-containing protein [Chloroflexota bacterium]
MSSDFYKILQVDPSAEPEIIEAAYKRLVRKYHPDVNTLPDATARIQEINDAYEVLSNPALRAEYDWQRQVALLPPPARRKPVSAPRWWLITTLGVAGALLILGACAFFSGAFVFLREQLAPTSTRVARIATAITIVAPSPTLTRTFTPEPTFTRTRTPRPTLRPSATPTSAPLGFARERPMPLGQGVVWTGREGEQIRFTLLNAYRGDEARMLIQSANPANPAPPPDWVYLLFKVRAEFVKAGLKSSVQLSEYDFRALASQEYAVTDAPTLAPPSPRLMKTLAAGESLEGWIAFAIPADEADAVLAYGQTIFPNEMRVWMSVR